MTRICIAHAAWMPSRKATLLRLIGQLGLGDRHDIEVFESDRREHASVWSQRVWEYAAEEGAVILNDDVSVCPEFGAVVEAMLQAVPQAPALSLHASMPALEAVVAEGYRWARAYRYTGPAVWLSAESARSLLDYAAGIPWEIRARINEDNVAMLWAWDRQEPFWVPVPSPAVHDTTTVSSLGYDEHPNRACLYPWTDFPKARMTDPTYWRCPEAPPCIENDWYSTDFMQSVRTLWKAGQTLCSMCLERRSIVGAQGGVRLCGHCLGQCTAAVMGGIK